MISAGTNACMVDQVKFDLSDELPVKNTFVHFVNGGLKSLRACKSEPMNIGFAQVNKPEAVNVCMDAKVTLDVTDEEIFLIQTPEVTPRCFEGPLLGDKPLVGNTTVHFQFTLPNELPIKNTFVNFECSSSQLLRICNSDLADSFFPSIQWGHRDGDNATQD